MPAVNHTHSYVKMRGRRDYPNTLWFKCNDPKCTHYAPYKLVLGKASLCFGCGEEFVLTAADLRRSKPKCLKCSDTKQARIHKTAAAIVNDLFGDLDDKKDNGDGHEDL